MTCRGGRSAPGGKSSGHGAIARLLFITSLLVLAFPVGTRAQYTYTTNADNTLTITGYQGADSAPVLIPSEIGGLAVTALGENAFSAFLGNSYASSVVIPGCVITIGPYCFDENLTLLSVTIGSGVTNIGYEAFDACTSLESINVEAANLFYSSFDGVLFDKNQTTLLEFPRAIGGAYTAPTTTTTLANQSFWFCGGLTKVVIPNSVTNLGSETFTGCGALTNVVIGDGLASIGNNDFGLCGALSSVVIGKSVTNIGSGAFNDQPWFNGNSKIYFRGNAPAADDTVFNATATTAYYLPGTTGWAQFSTNTGVPAVLWNPVIQQAAPGLRGNPFSFNIAGSTNIPVVVEACTDLSNPAWTPLQSFNLTNGLVRFTDAQSTNSPTRFYRLRSP